MRTNWLGIFWLAAERVLVAISGLMTAFLIARFMGPADYGTFAFVFAVVGIGLSAGHLGMDSLLVRSFVKSEHSGAHIIGTAVAMKGCANAIVFIAVIAALFLFVDNSNMELELFLLTGPIFLLSSVTAVLVPWFKAREDFRSLLTVRLIAVMISIIVKIYVIITGLPLLAMTAAHVLYFVVEAAVLVRVFRSNNGAAIINWRFRGGIARDLFARGLPLFLGSIVATTYMNIDLIMLWAFWDANTVGEYALVPQLLLAVQIIPYAITSVVFPSIVSFIEHDNVSRASKLCRRAYGELLVASLGVFLMIVFVFRPLTPVVFGAEYEASLTPMLIVAFATPLIFFRHLNTKLFVAYDIRFTFLRMELAGLSINIVLNALLIPIYAGSGAAFATILAYATSTLVMPLMLARGREIFVPILRNR